MTYYYLAYFTFFSSLQKMLLRYSISKISIDMRAWTRPEWKRPNTSSAVSSLSLCKSFNEADVSSGLTSFASEAPGEMQGEHGRNVY